MHVGVLPPIHYSSIDHTPSEPTYVCQLSYLNPIQSSYIIIFAAINNGGPHLPQTKTLGLRQACGVHVVQMCLLQRQML